MADAIYLEYPQNLRQHDKPVDWNFGPTEFNRMFEKARYYDGPVYATIAGRLDPRAELSTYPNGSRLPYGYEHLNAFPERIVLKEIKDLTGVGLRKEPKEYLYVDVE